LILKGANIVWTGTVGRGGHIMYALQWLHGLRRLGREVLSTMFGSCIEPLVSKELESQSERCIKQEMPGAKVLSE
jgi:hypothetical protein